MVGHTARVCCCASALIMFATFFVGWTTSILAAPPSITLPPHLQIMLLGDSITYGTGQHHGYRGPLGMLLSGVTTNFVFAGSSVDAALPDNQQHHEGHPSYAIDNVYTNLDGFDDTLYQKYHGNSRLPNGGHWFDGIASGPNARPPLYPDVILLMIGTNDRDNIAGAQSRLDRLVSKIVTLRPHAHLIIARLTPIKKTDAYGTFVDTYNREVDAVVAKYATNHLVTEVDLNTGFPSNGLGHDLLHPNDTGYNWMATQWYNAILTVYGPK